MAVKPPPPLVMLRAVEMDGSIWFIASDVCEALGIPKGRPERLSGSMLATVKSDEGRKELAINAEGLLCLLASRERGRSNTTAFLLGSSVSDREGRALHETAPFHWNLVQGAKEAIQAVNVAWPAEPATACAD